MIYFIRHAKKEDNSVHSMLTKQGLIDAYNYGEKLKKNHINIELIITSPIGRCVETAQEIIKGYGSVKIKKSKLLGDSGIYVIDGKKAMDVFYNNSLVDIINMQLSSIELNGFLDIKKANQKLVEFMKKEKKDTLYISHDAIITPFIYSMKEIKRVEEKDIVHYLEGYSISKIKEKRQSIEPFI